MQPLTELRGERRRFVDDRDLVSATAVFGANHPLTRALRRQGALEVQLGVTLALVPISLFALTVHVEYAPLALGATMAVALAFLLAAVSARQAAREVVLELIVSGEDDVALGFVQRERSRLESLTERRKLSRALERLLDDAGRCDRSPPPFRPLPGVECLRVLEAETRSVIESLRGERPNVRGVALVARLIGDGAVSPLYAGDVRALRQELRRILYVLESVATPERNTGAARAA